MHAPCRRALFACLLVAPTSGLLGGCTSVGDQTPPELAPTVTTEGIGQAGAAQGQSPGSPLQPVKGTPEEEGELPEGVVMPPEEAPISEEPEAEEPAGPIGGSLTPPEPPATNPDDSCVSNKDYFVHNVWTPILAADCLSCHNTFGQAAGSKFILSDSYQTGFLDENLEALEKMASYSHNGVPSLLVKPMGGDNHGGGVRFLEGTPEHAAMSAMLARFNNPVVCDEVVEEALFGGVDVLDSESTLRKARMVLTSELPSETELSYLDEMGDEGLDLALLALMEEPAFFRWLKEAYNEVFMTSAYAKGNKALNLLDEADFPNKLWHESCDPATTPNCAIEEFAENAAEYTNWSVAQDTLELVVHVVRNNLPFSDIVMADYTMVNPYSAKTFGVTDVYFNNPLDPHEFRPAKLKLAGGEGLDYPHAGVLTSPMWLNRFPTTDSNVNRHRARMVYKQFLATDLLKLAERPVDQAQITAHNPTMNETACAVCHVVTDPVAGAFQNFDNAGLYRPPEEGWHAEMRPPGFGGEGIEAEASEASLQWLALRLAGDHRFVTSTVHTMFKALMGVEPIAPPTDPKVSDYSLQLSIYLQQDKYFKEIGDVFVESNYNLKSLIIALIKSPYFRARQVQALSGPVPTGNVDEEAHAASLQQLGTSRLLTPEELDRKIEVVTGTPWTKPSNGKRWLLNDYRIYYGGIDFGESSERITEMNGTMANIAERMANEVACKAVAADLMREMDARNLFPFVEWDYAPTEHHGFAVPEMDELIRLNILHLHELLLNEVLDTNSPEFMRTYELFVSVLEGGQEMIDNGLAVTNLPEACQFITMSEESMVDEESLVDDPVYSVRAWMAVVSYLLADYRFLYH